MMEPKVLAKQTQWRNKGSIKNLSKNIGYKSTVTNKFYKTSKIVELHRKQLTSTSYPKSLFLSWVWNWETVLFYESSHKFLIDPKLNKNKKVNLNLRLLGWQHSNRILKKSLSKNLNWDPCHQPLGSLLSCLIKVDKQNISISSSWSIEHYQKCSQ